MHGLSETGVTTYFQRRAQIAVTFVDFASKACKYKMPPPLLAILPACLLYRVLTTSALGGAKVDMSTIYTNYKRLSECQMIFRSCARPSSKKIGF